MEGILVISLVLFNGIAATVETDSSGGLYYKQVALKAECEGDYTYKGYVADLEACGQACIGEGEMFVYGTNLYGNNRCNSDGCRCYCAKDTTNGRCNKRTSHNGYILYSYPDSVAGVGFTPSYTGSKCTGCETYKGEMASARECFLACKATADMFAFGTKSSGKNSCFCQDNTNLLNREGGFVDIGSCKEVTTYAGFNLYAIRKVRNLPRESWKVSMGKGNRECGGAYEEKGNVDTPGDCADACRGISGMFAFGPSPDPKLGRCTENCRCKCLQDTIPVCGSPRRFVRDYGYILYAVYGKVYRPTSRRGMCSASGSIYKGYMATYKMCGYACKGYSMFRYGLKGNKGRTPRTPNTCNQEGCQCFCENDTIHKCKEYRYYTNWDIFTFVGKNEANRDD